MAKLLAVLLLFVQVSLQQKNPISDFCRRFGHQTAVVDQKLYIDGGMVDWNPISANPANYTSMHMPVLDSSSLVVYADGANFSFQTHGYYTMI